jgi:hypothetical protein
MYKIIYLIYLSIVLVCSFTMRTAKAHGTSWQNLVILLCVAGAYICGYFSATC